MPYYLHTVGIDPALAEDLEQFGRPYDSKTDALNNRQDGQSVTFVCTEDEYYAWRRRERRRFEAGVYCPVPWANALTAIPDHFAHVSLDKDGLIAYTPDQEYGHLDKQKRVRPGKYLQEFYGEELLPGQIEFFTAQVRSLQSGELQIVTTPADIATIYRHGPTSCMDAAHESSGCFRSAPYHPTEVYGDSDLAVAYLGTFERCTARTVVWPERKVYTRIYGDSALACVLQSKGWTHGTLSGAKIRRLFSNNGDLVMPYVDAADGVVSIRRDAQHMRLTCDDSESEFTCKQTNGLGVVVERHYCANCDNEIGEDDTYCQTCDDDHWTCTNCGDDSFDTSDATNIGGDWYCSDCASALQAECELCSNTWYTVRHVGRYDMDGDRLLRWSSVLALQARHVDSLCEECASEHDHCQSCDSGYVEIGLTHCSDCAPLGIDVMFSAYVLGIRFPHYYASERMAA